MHLFVLCIRQRQRKIDPVSLLLGHIIVQLQHNCRVKLLRLTVRLRALLGSGIVIHSESAADSCKELTHKLGPFSVSIFDWIPNLVTRSSKTMRATAVAFSCRYGLRQLVLSIVHDNGELVSFFNFRQGYKYVYTDVSEEIVRKKAIWAAVVSFHVHCSAHMTDTHGQWRKHRRPCEASTALFSSRRIFDVYLGISSIRNDGRDWGSDCGRLLVRLVEIRSPNGRPCPTLHLCWRWSRCLAFRRMQNHRDCQGRRTVWLWIWSMMVFPLMYCQWYQTVSKTPWKKRQRVFWVRR